MKKEAEHKQNINRDEQEDFYTELAKTEGDKFDSRLFWVTGGTVVLSLTYLQINETLKPNCLLAWSYIFLIISLFVMLAGLLFSSRTYGKLASHYRGINNGDEGDEDFNKLDTRARTWIPWINIIALASTFIGIVLLVFFVFQQP